VVAVPGAAVADGMVRIVVMVLRINEGIRLVVLIILILAMDEMAEELELELKVELILFAFIILTAGRVRNIYISFPSPHSHSEIPNDTMHVDEMAESMHPRSHTPTS
jgi:hypothetical protein